MKRQEGEARLRKLRLALSAVIVLFGLVMMVSTLTRFGPSPFIGVVFGGGFVFYGTLRAFRALKS